MTGRGVLLFAAVGLVAACSSVEVEEESLTEVVERDVITFDMESIPDEVLDRLASNKVVIVGETHWIYEHRELMATLVRELHERGFRQLVLEFPQAAEWLLEDYVNGGMLEPSWIPPNGLDRELIVAVRDFNRTLPRDERVAVKGVDVMLEEYGGAADFTSLIQSISKHVERPEILEEFVGASHGTPEGHSAGLDNLKTALQTGRPELEPVWGTYWYDCVLEMVEVERVSVMIRTFRDDRYDLSVRLRENVMKQLSDKRLKDYPHRTLFNVGGNHAQKSYLKGTKQEWLGDYLVNSSSAVGGHVVVLSVSPAQIVTEDGSQTLWDVHDVSPPNELWRTLGEVGQGQIAFLPLEDPIFSASGILMNYEDTIYNGAPKDHYDVMISLPSARRIPH